ncbi:MAG: hypothetical protein WCT05_02820 [Lentisphaeria bacterium]
MKNPLPVLCILGSIFACLGLIGTFMMVLLFCFLPLSVRGVAWAASVFPIFMFLGVVFRLIGSRACCSEKDIREFGKRYPAKVVRILKCFGRRPVRSGSIYAAEVEITIEAETVSSRVYFYGRDFAAIEALLHSGESVDILYYAKSRLRSLIV